MNIPEETGGEIDSCGDWGQFVDIEVTQQQEIKPPTRPNKLFSLVQFCFYNNAKPRTAQPEEVDGNGKQDENVIQEDDADSDAEFLESEDDQYDSDSSDEENGEDEEETQENQTDQEECQTCICATDLTSSTNSKQNNPTSIMKKLYRSVSMSKSRRSTAVLPNNGIKIVYRDNPADIKSETMEGKQTEPCFQAMNQNEKLTSCHSPNLCMKALVANTSICDFCASQSPVLKVDMNGRYITLSVPEATAILIALHPKASCNIAAAAKLKLQFERADMPKQTQIISSIAKEKLASLLTRIRANTVVTVS